MRREAPRAAESGAALAARPYPGHQQSQPVDVDLGTVELADDRPLVHDGEPIGQRQQLFELLRHKEDGGTGSALSEELSADVLGRADVESLRRLRDDKELGPAR